MSDQTFSYLEREGWQRNASEYDSVDLPATRQAFAPLLDSVGILHGRHLLEIASGTGHLAADALARGATVVGVDVAPNMVALARQHVPGANFREGDAEALPFQDKQFDSVLCCFGLLHFARPDQALREAARVLKPGGVLSFTVWCAPEQGGEFFGLILKTYQSHASMDVGLPPAPPMFGLADPSVRDPMLTQAGFREIRARKIAIVWPIRGAETPFDFVLNGAVRTRMVYERQTPQVQQRIRDALAAATAPHVSAGGIPSPAVLVTATRT
ncbi:MAG TPA: methyltransferase domain-containing protein [Burkholderiales bacterium]|nr:methyltransferase domain-containing protein [Burkholderiales bacterium]